MKRDLPFTFRSQAVINDFLAKLLASRQPYQLPGVPGQDEYLLPVSGGADSSALAILLHFMFPEINFTLVYSDTKAEDVGIYECLDRLEAYLGKSIHRIIPEKGLFELVDEYNGYLPSAQSRWCTRVLKLENFNKWMDRFKGKHKLMFVGIRSDESTRIAFTIDDVTTEMPYVDMGMKREDVFAILDMTIGIPSFYRRRVRSGCSTCFFQRRSELVGLLQEQPIEFMKGIRTEKLAATDAERHAEATPLWKESGISANWLSLPPPQSGDSITGKKPKLKTLDIFGMKGIFVGAEFFTDGFLSNDEFIWHQKVVSYSPTLAGIRRQIDDRYRHLLGTGEVYGLSPDDVREKAKFAIYYLELPDHLFDPAGPGEGSYTWQKGASYKQLRHIITFVTKALQAENMRQQSLKSAHPLTVQYEWIEGAKAGFAKLNDDIGQVVTSQWYQPAEEEPELTVEEEVLNVPCPMCSI